MSSLHKYEEIEGVEKLPSFLDSDWYFGFHWPHLKSEDFDRQIDQIACCSGVHWEATLPYMSAVPLASRERFWRSFRTLEARRKRVIAARSVVEANLETQIKFIKDMRVIDDDMNIEDNSFKVYEGVNLTRAVAIEGFKIMDAIVRNDHDFFTKLAKAIKLLESGEAPEKGGEDTINGQMIREFTLFHVQTMSIPTKAWLRKAIGLGSAPEDLKKANKAFSELGLSGLPGAGSD